MVEIDLDALASFVNEQITFHAHLAEQARATNDERKLIRHQSIIGRYGQLSEVLTEVRTRPKRDEIKRLALTWDEVHDLPPELLKELSVTDGDKLEFDLVQIIDDVGGVASLDRLLVELYRRNGEIYQRTWLNNRLYRMVQKDMIHSVPGRKGVYSIDLLTKEDAATLL